MNIEDDASTLPSPTDAKDDALSPEDETLCVNLFLPFFLFFFFFRKEKCNSSTLISSMVLGQDFEQIFIRVFGR